METKVHGGCWTETQFLYHNQQHRNAAEIGETSTTLFATQFATSNTKLITRENCKRIQADLKQKELISYIELFSRAVKT